MFQETAARPQEQGTQGEEKKAPALTTHQIAEVLHNASLRLEIGFQVKVGKVGGVPLRKSFIKKMTGEQPEVQFDGDGFVIITYGYSNTFRSGNKDLNGKFLEWVAQLQADLAANISNRSNPTNCSFDQLQQ